MLVRDIRARAVESASRSKPRDRRVIMATTKSRIDLLELEVFFRKWLWHERLLESLSVEQLEEYAYLGRLPEPLPEPVPKGTSKLDGLSRKRLIELWEENQRYFARRSSQEMIYFSCHGHWPERACDQQECSKARSDEIVRRHEPLGLNS